MSTIERLRKRRIAKRTPAPSTRVEVSADAVDAGRDRDLQPAAMF